MPLQIQPPYYTTLLCGGLIHVVSAWPLSCSFWLANGKPWNKGQSQVGVFTHLAPCLLAGDVPPPPEISISCKPVLCTAICLFPASGTAPSTGSSGPRGGKGAPLLPALRVLLFPWDFHKPSVCTFVIVPLPNPPRIILICHLLPAEAPIKSIIALTR